MKKWLRRTLIAALLAGLTLAALYEAATHVGRGWLRGEAFYEGRPTSYWRGKIDDWMEQFDTVEEARDVIEVTGNFTLSKECPIFSSFTAGWDLNECWFPQKAKTRKQNWVRVLLKGSQLEGEIERNVYPPKVLWGFAGAENVLSELAKEAKLRPLVDQAMENERLISETVTLFSKLSPVLSE